VQARSYILKLFRHIILLNICNISILRQNRAMTKDYTPVQSCHNNNSSSKKQNKLKDERLAAALRANLRRRKLANSSLNNEDDKGAAHE